MTSYEKPTERPGYGTVFNFDHVHWWVGNAKQAASWFVARMGFEPLAYRGLETGHRNMVTHVVRQGKIMFAFSSPLNPPEVQKTELGQDMAEHHKLHGDAVKDVAFCVSDARKMYQQAMERGAESVREPFEEEDENGKVLMATVKTYGDTVHTFVQRDRYNGPFLPNFKPVELHDPLVNMTAPVGLNYIDHIVGNVPEGEMNPQASWYEKVLQFHRFWSVDDSQIHTEYSALRSVVMADFDENIKMPINEPAKGKRKSQIQEYVDYYGGKGVQHIALNTRDIIHAIKTLKSRGVEFLKVPDTYYEALYERLERAGIKVKEDMQTIRDLSILVDFDDNGYLLQLFTKPLMDRPTVFLEIIQREGNQGFGAGNFKSLFEAIERDQALRGNLTET